MGKKQKRTLDARIAAAVALGECLKALGEVMAAGKALRKGQRKEAQTRLTAALKLLDE